MSGQALRVDARIDSAFEVPGMLLAELVQPSGGHLRTGVGDAERGQAFLEMMARTSAIITGLIHRHRP